MSEKSELLKKQYGISNDSMKHFPVPDEDVKHIAKKPVTREDNTTVDLYCCPYCLDKENINTSDYRFTNMDSDFDCVHVHMMICQDNPLRIEYDQKCLSEYNRLFSGFKFDSGDNNSKDNSPTKIDGIFMMGSGFYHRALSKPNDKIFDLCYITHESEEAYLGNFVFGIGMMNVIWLKSNIRKLTPEEVKEFNNQNISINDNYPHASISIDDNEYKQPIV